jgi:hypothetical protein
MTHTMIYTGEHAGGEYDGAEEWRCPVCGRDMLFEYDPPGMIVLEPGDANAGHNGSRGGLVIVGRVDVEQ